MIDKRVLAVIRAVAREQETPAVVVEAVIARLLPSIRLVPQFPKEGEEPRLGGCRIGGLPDLPKGVKWPRLSTAWKVGPEELDKDDVIPFLTQINLAEVAPFDVAGVLPKTGMLYFFFLMDDESDEFNVSYIRFDREVGRLERRKAPRDLKPRWRFRGVDVVPHLEWTVPSPADCGADEALVNEHLEFWDDLVDRVAEVQKLEGAYAMASNHRLLGHPQLIQTPGLGEGTRLLLQVCSDAPEPVRAQYPQTGMMWGDGGRVYYLINDEELRTHRLDEEPWAMVEMC